MAGLLGLAYLLPANLPRSRSFQCLTACYAVAVTVIGVTVNFVKLFQRCGEIFNDHFIAKFLLNVPVAAFFKRLVPIFRFGEDKKQESGIDSLCSVYKRKANEISPTGYLAGGLQDKQSKQQIHEFFASP